MSFLTMPEGSTGLPLSPHPGSFGFVRKHHTHEGVDLYAPEGTPVYAVEAGQIVAIIPFTGPQVDMPWWNDTHAVLVEGNTGVVLYGEIVPDASLKVGWYIGAGHPLGSVTAVLRHDKGRPMAMLHLELYDHIVREPVEWIGVKRPDGLKDPTPYLTSAKSRGIDRV